MRPDGHLCFEMSPSTRLYPKRLKADFASYSCNGRRIVDDVPLHRALWDDPGVSCQRPMK